MTSLPKEKKKSIPVIPALKFMPCENKIHENVEWMKEEKKEG